jgi:hypothetical protein
VTRKTSRIFRETLVETMPKETVDISEVGDRIEAELATKKAEAEEAQKAENEKRMFGE